MARRGTDPEIHSRLYRCLKNLTLFKPAGEHLETMLSQNMFTVPNKGAMQAVFHYLLSIVFESENIKIAKTHHVYEWPTISPQDERIFRNMARNVILELKEKHPEAQLPHVNPSFLMNPGGDKFACIILKLAMFLLHKILESQNVDNLLPFGIQDRCPSTSRDGHLVKVRIKIYKSMTLAATRAFIKQQMETAELEKAARDCASEIVTEIKSVQSEMRELREREQRHREEPDPPSHEEIGAMRSEAEGQLARLRVCHATLSPDLEKIRSILNLRSEKSRVDGSELAVRVPKFVADGPWGKMLVEKLYVDKKLHLPTLVAIGNECLRILVQKLPPRTAVELTVHLPELEALGREARRRDSRLSAGLLSVARHTAEMRRLVSELPEFPGTGRLEGQISYLGRANPTPPLTPSLKFVSDTPCRRQVLPFSWGDKKCLEEKTSRDTTDLSDTSTLKGKTSKDTTLLDSSTLKDKTSTDTTLSDTSTLRSRKWEGGLQAILAAQKEAARREGERSVVRTPAPELDEKTMEKIPTPKTNVKNDEFSSAHSHPSDTPTTSLPAHTKLAPTSRKKPSKCCPSATLVGTPKGTPNTFFPTIPEDSPLMNVSDPTSAFNFSLPVTSAKSATLVHIPSAEISPPTSASSSTSTSTFNFSLPSAKNSSSFFSRVPKNLSLCDVQSSASPLNITQTPLKDIAMTSTPTSCTFPGNLPDWFKPMETGDSILSTTPSSDHDHLPLASAYISLTEALEFRPPSSSGSGELFSAANASRGEPVGSSLLDDCDLPAVNVMGGGDCALDRLSLLSDPSFPSRFSFFNSDSSDEDENPRHTDLSKRDETPLEHAWLQSDHVFQTPPNVVESRPESVAVSTDESRSIQSTLSGFENLASSGGETSDPTSTRNKTPDAPKPTPAKKGRRSIDAIIERYRKTKLYQERLKSSQE